MNAQYQISFPYFQRITESCNVKIGQETDRNFKEKTKIEKELRNMTKRAEKAELDLIKAESVKTVQGGSGEALFQDMLGNLKEFMEGQLQCSICNEIYVYPSGQSKILFFYCNHNSFLRNQFEYQIRQVNIL